jgi:hypothetical protein
LADYRAAPSEVGAREVADAMIRANAAYLLYQRLTKNQDQSGLPFQRGNPQQWVPADDN